MLFDLLDDNAIVSVTTLSRDPRLSPFSVRARAIHGNHGRAEEALALAPDLIIAARDSNALAVELLRRSEQRVAVFPSARDLASYRENFLRLGALLSRRYVAQKKFAGLLSALAAARQTRRPPRASALVFLARGYVPGSPSLLDDIMAGAGLRNAATALNLHAGGVVSLEKLLLNAPDFLLMDQVSPARPALGETLLSHRALARFRQRHPQRLRARVLPMRAWTCPSTHLATTVAGLVKVTTTPP